MKRRLLIGAAAALAVALLAALLDPTYTVRGLLRGEKFFQGRPTSYWRHALVTENPGIQTETHRRLSEAGAEAVPVLAELVGQPSGSEWEAAEVRWKAADLLGRLGPKARDAVPALIAATQDRDAHVRSVTIAALGDCGAHSPTAATALGEQLKGGERLEALKALAKLGKLAAAAVPEIVPLLKDKSNEVRWNAARTLGEIGPAALLAAPALVAALADPDDEVREHAAESLGQIGPGAKDAVPVLIKTLKDENDRVRRDAARSLGEMGAAAKDSLPALKALASDPSNIVREAAARSVRQIDPASVGR